MYAGRISAAQTNHPRGVFLGRVVFVCWLQYILDLAVPEAQWIKPEFANGEHVDWLRICGWMATRHPPLRAHSRPSTPPPTHVESIHTRPPPTPPKHCYDCRNPLRSPVLILFLVSMTTIGGREASPLPWPTLPPHPIPHLDPPLSPAPNPSQASVRVVPFLVANQVRSHEVP